MRAAIDPEHERRIIRRSAEADPAVHYCRKSSPAMPFGPRILPLVAGYCVPARPVLSMHRRDKGTSMRKSSGFTLIELMVVIVIVAIVVAVVIRRRPKTPPAQPPVNPPSPPQG